MLQGDKIRLTAIKEDDLPAIAKWYEDADFLRLYDAASAAPKTESSFKKWIEEENQNEAFRFAIRLKDHGKIIGFVEIDGILWNQRNAWISIAIGDVSQRGEGYGKEALELAVAFAFDELNLHRLQLTVFDYNTRAISLYEKLGFQKEGSYREFLRRDGKTYNMELYGILEHEWKKARSTD